MKVVRNLVKIVEPGSDLHQKYSPEALKEFAEELKTLDASLPQDLLPRTKALVLAYGRGIDDMLDALT
jgi:hypothetical protein